VPSFGDPGARLLVVGLAPGRQGANRTGRPFTGDYAGDLLYATLLHFGFAQGQYGACADDGLSLRDCMITNAVRCAPPKNRPDPAEIRQCNAFLAGRIESLPRLAALLALGRIAHDAVLRALQAKARLHPFGHGAVHEIGRLRLHDSYHCSRYNTSTGVLTVEMFQEVIREIRRTLT
jgi:uracil-DNA glycosylase family 4